MEKEEVSKMKLKELREIMREQMTYPLDVLGLVITEFKRRIPYCEICGEKAPLYNIMNVDGVDRKVCLSCDKVIMGFGTDFFCIEDEI